MGIFANPTKIRPFNHTTHSTQHNSCNFLEAPKHTLEVRPKSIHSNSLCPLRIKTPWHTHLKKTRLLERNEKEKDDKSQYFLTRGDRANTHTGIYICTHLKTPLSRVRKRRSEGERERKRAATTTKFSPFKKLGSPGGWALSLSLRLSRGVDTKQPRPADRMYLARVARRRHCCHVAPRLYACSVYVYKRANSWIYRWGACCTPVFMGKEREREKESEGRNASARQSSNKLYRRGIILALSEGIQRWVVGYIDWLVRANKKYLCLELDFRVCDVCVMFSRIIWSFK